MAVKLGDAFIALGIQDRDLDRGLRVARSRVNTFLRDITTGMAQGLGQAVASGVGNAIRGGLTRIDEAVKKASDLNETIARTNAVYRENAQEVIAWSQTTSRALGVSQEAALNATGSLGNMFLQMGFGGQEAASFSRRLVEASADIVAFHNVSEGVPSVLNDIASAFRGEYDPIQKYIPLINAATVEQQALVETGKESAKQLTAGEKAAAAYTLIIQGMGAATGAAARELESAASQQRIFDARMEESAARLGQVFLPVRQAFFRGLNELLDLVEPYGVNIMDSLAQGLADGIVAILPVLQQVRALFTYWLKPGSPPRLLKEIDKWGKQAMEEYLKGWTTADFDALQTAGGMIERVVRSFAASGNIKETDLVARIFGTTRAMTQAVRDMRNLGHVTEDTLAAIANAAGPAGTEVARLTREFFDLQRATQRVTEAQSALNVITNRYQAALSPIDRQLAAIRNKQQEIRENQRLEQLGEIIRDPRADVEEKQLARLEAQEIQLERQARAIESERDAAVDAAQEKLRAAQEEERAQRERFQQAQNALEQQIKTNSLIEEEAALRERLANEAIAAQEKALRELEARQRELEAQERKRLAELERIADAQLRWRLASTDTAGQLEIMREELAKVEEGSAEYYNILTQIIGLEERLKKERDSAGGGALPTLIDQVIGDSGEMEQATGGIAALTEALDRAFAALKGTDGQQVELAPAWQQFGDTIKEIGRFAQEASPLVQGFIDLVMGKDVQLEGDGDPFGDNFWLAGIIPGIRGIITNLKLIRDRDWSGLWQGFKDYVDKVIERTSDGSDPRTFGLYTWIRDTAIPLLDGLANGEWAEAWGEFEAAVRGAWDAAVDYIDARIEDIKEALQDLKEAWEWLQGIEPPTGPFNGQPGGGGAGGGGGDFSSFRPNFPGILPQVPQVAPVTAGPTTNESNIYYIEQHIATGGDFGGARAGAEEGIRQALINRRIQGI